MGIAMFLAFVAWWLRKKFGKTPNTTTKKPRNIDHKTMAVA
jgi:hypothetical protein